MCRSPKKSAQKIHTRHRKLLDRTRYTKKTATRKNSCTKKQPYGKRLRKNNIETRCPNEFLKARAQARAQKLGPKPGSPGPSPGPSRAQARAQARTQGRAQAWPGPSPGLSPGPTLGESREGRHGRLIKPVADSGSYRGDLGTPKHETTYSNLNAGNRFFAGTWMAI